MGAAYYGFTRILSQLQAGEEREQAEQKQVEAAALKRLDKIQYAGSEDGSDADLDNPSRTRRRWRKEDLQLNRYEQMIAMDVVAPDDISVTFAGKTLHIGDVSIVNANGPSVT